jgi:hypothetical protein
MTLPEHARDAILIQNACNISGVARSFVEAIDAIRESGTQGQSNYDIAHHPIVTLFVSKFASLNGTDCLCSDCMDTFSRAMKACEKLAGVNQ